MDAETAGKFVGAIIIYIFAQAVMQYRNGRQTPKLVKKEVTAALSDDKGKSFTQVMQDQFQAQAELLKQFTSAVPTLSEGYSDVVRLLSRENERNSLTIDSQAQKLIDMSNRLDESKRVTDQILADLEAATSERSELKTFVNDMLEANKKRDIEVKAQLDKVEGSLADTEQKLKATRLELDEAKRQLVEAQDTIKNIQAETLKSDAEKVDLLRQLDEEKAKVTKLQQTVKEQQEKIEGLERDLASLTANASHPGSASAT